MAGSWLAPSLVRLRDEVNRRWPGRDTASDGWIGNGAHQAGVSDLDGDGDVDADDAALKSQHNPDADGIVHALDIDRDGIDPAALLDAAIRHPATWYVIWNRNIYSRKNGFARRPYAGTNPHTGHVHVSIQLTRAAERSTARWLPILEDEMTPDEIAAAVRPAMRAELSALFNTDTAAGRLTDAAERDPQLDDATPFEVSIVAARRAYDAFTAAAAARAEVVKLREELEAATLGTGQGIAQLSDQIRSEATIDPAALAEKLAAPLVEELVTQLPDEMLAGLAGATADEIDRRLRARLDWNAGAEG